jgi:hypothetical protein
VTVLKKFVERPDILESYKSKSRHVALNEYSWEKTVQSVFEAKQRLD